MLVDEHVEDAVCGLVDFASSRAPLIEKDLKKAVMFEETLNIGVHHFSVERFRHALFVKIEAICGLYNYGNDRECKEGF